MKYSLTDLDAIIGVQKGDERVARELFASCRSYFYERHGGVFDFKSSTAQELSDLFQDSFLKLWIEIKSHKIYIRDNYPWRTDRSGRERRMSANLRTYLMAIAKYRNYEMIREEEIYQGEMSNVSDRVDEAPEDLTLEQIVLQCVNALPPRCKDILTKFYYDNMSLDEILISRQENTSKDGLKSGKSKCMSQLKGRITTEMNRHNIKLPNNGKQ